MKVEKPGIGFLGLLALLLIGLKLSGIITMSWVWVLSPIWVPPVIVIAAFVIFVIIPLIIFSIRKR